LRLIGLVLVLVLGSIVAATYWLVSANTLIIYTFLTVVIVYQHGNKNVHKLN